MAQPKGKHKKKKKKKNNHSKHVSEAVITTSFVVSFILATISIIGTYYGTISVLEINNPN